MTHDCHSSVSHTRADAPYSGFVESMRQTWNDARMDEFAGRTEENFREVRAEAHDTGLELRDEIRSTRRELRSEVRGVRTELKGEIRDLRTEMNGRFARIERRFDVMFGAMITGFVGLIISHFLG